MTIRPLTSVLLAVILTLVCGGAALANETSVFNLALAAKATASESYQDLTPDKAIDGNPSTRWCAIPGHSEGNWFQLDWDKPVKIGEVVIQQFDRYATAMDIQVWDGAAGSWRTVQHMGQPNLMLPRAVLCRMKTVETTRLRIADITGGASFTDVLVSETAGSAYEPSVRLASDVDGGFIGMVTDPWGSAPTAGAEVLLSGKCKAGEWRRRAVSDDKGLFFAPMPVGMQGKVKAEITTSKDRKAKAVFDSADFVYGLTPVSIDDARTSLNGKWRFTLDPPDEFWKPDFDDSKWPDIDVPAHWEMQGFTSVEGIGGYRKRFSVPDASGRLKIRFEGVYSGAEVWVNGRRLAYHECGATPFEVDLSDVAIPGENVIALRVSEHTFTSEHLDKMSYYAGFPLAGIMRDVYLFSVPEAHIGAVRVSARFDAAYRNAVLAGTIAVVNESGQPMSGASLRFSLLDSDKRPVRIDAKPVGIDVDAWSRSESTFELAVDSPRKWNAEDPNLYTLQIQLVSGDKAVQTLKQRIGFRQTEIKGTKILVNGSPVKLRGTCHHDQHPLMGRAVDYQTTRQDIELIREANLNALRTSHYPPIPCLLDLADEMGIYVESEAPMCWVAGSNDLNNTPRIIQLAAELLARDRNHPSIFMWSICNESEYGYGLQRCAEWVKAADPTRPVTASGTANINIATRHNPITTAAVEGYANATMPVIWDESFAPFQGIFGEVAELWVDPGMRDYYIEPFIPAWDAFISSKTVQGSMIWCWCDDLFCVPNRSIEYGRVAVFSNFVEEQYGLPDRGIVGDAPWGLVDGWRRRKPEFWLIKKLQSPVDIAEKPIPAPEAGKPISIAVSNHYDFTDLSELKVEWRLGDRKGTIEASVPPRSTGVLAVPAAAAKPGDALEMEFTDRFGVLVDSFRVPIVDDRRIEPRFAGSRPKPLRLLEENQMSGFGTRVVGEDFELSFNRGAWGMGNGYLHRCVGFGRPLLMEYPTIHILPLENPMTPMPDRLSWKMREMDAKQDGENVRLTLLGAYDGFDGAYELLITPEGEITATSRFTYTGEDFQARETGLRISVPKRCNVLEWDRQAEWNVYPSDHIGRPHGRAVSFADHPAEVPPGWSWSEDNSPMGSADFRSTKRRINWTSIRYPDGVGVLIESDGTQHVRAMVETDRISLHINDFFGGSNVGRWAPRDLTCFSDNYGTGRLIKRGDVLESKVRLRIVRFQKE